MGNGTGTLSLKCSVCIAETLGHDCSKPLPLVILINSSFTVACFYAKALFLYCVAVCSRTAENKIGLANPYKVYPELAGGHRYYFFSEEKIPPSRRKNIIHTRSRVKTPYHTVCLGR